MKIKNLHKLPNGNTWMWRTVEGDTGDYYTFDNGKGMNFMNQDVGFRVKMATFEKFKACKTESGMRKKLNRIFATRTEDPTPENPWKL